MILMSFCMAFWLALIDSISFFKSPFVCANACWPRTASAAAPSVNVKRAIFLFIAVFLYMQGRSPSEYYLPCWVLYAQKKKPATRGGGGPRKASWNGDSKRTPIQSAKKLVLLGRVNATRAASWHRRIRGGVALVQEAGLLISLA